MSRLLDNCSAIIGSKADSNLLRNNANKDANCIHVMRDMIAGEVCKELAVDWLTPEIIAAHNNGDIHVHDLDYSPAMPMPNCCLLDIEEMFKGFKMGAAEIETPKSVTTAMAVLVQIIANISSSQYGGISINDVDLLMEPYVKMSYQKHLEVGKQYIEDNDKAVVYATNQTRKEVMDACQGLEYEVNTLHTSNGQTPFVTLGFGLGTSWQAKLVQEGILRQRIAGLGGRGKTAIFPKLVYKVEKGINDSVTGCINSDIRRLAIECASKRNYPDMLYMPALRADGNGCTPMGCRSFLHKWVDPETGKEVWNGRNNLGVVSINLPRIALRCRGDVDYFYSELSRILGIAHDALRCRINRFKGVKAKVAPLMYCEGALGKRLQPEDEIMQLFDNYRASVSLGYIGVNEMCNAMFPDEPHMFESDVKKAFGVKVVQMLKDATNLWKMEEPFAYGLYSTPSESLCLRFAALDKADYGEIKGVTDKKYYTNSFHLDVEYSVNPLLKFEFEEPFHHIANSGRISYAEVPHIPRKQEDLLFTYIDVLWTHAQTIGIAYCGTNCVIDYCHACNTNIDARATENGFECPNCGCHDNRLEVTKRVCGYLGNPTERGFNDGKQDEVIRRVKHC
ncbi:anaerobic ribonucleoside-triphosphate reductase [Vibrio cholerae]|uniref:anaerobic ribonucleoside-triphosphate reductase n=2 Tax=Vibrio cholerae TaxID=666 RepID=UPI00053C661A|nr:anaerobic ribonucleoside-triphosphate reductase [Vibrio cholerae]